LFSLEFQFEFLSGRNLKKCDYLAKVYIDASPQYIDTVRTLIEIKNYFIRIIFLVSMKEPA